MGKTLKRLLAIALSLMLMFTMGTTVFAAGSDTAAGESAKSMADLEDGTYLLRGITSSFKMFKPTQPATLIVNGEDCTLIIEATGTPVGRYDQIYVGSQEDVDNITEEVVGVQGTVSNNVLRFEIPLKVSDISTTEPLYYAIRYRAGYSQEHDGDWYKPSSTAYFTLGEPVKQLIDLVTTNEEKMFKVVNSYIENTAEGTDFVFAMNSTGYADMIAGTYEEAIAIGKDKTQWIHGVSANVTVDYWMDATPGAEPEHITEGIKSKLQFRIPVEELSSTGTVRIPFVAVSKSKAEEAEAADPDNPDYSNAFYARQALVDTDAKTVRISNFKDTVDVTVGNQISGFNVADTAQIYSVGSPAANEYTCQPTITMTDATYDKAFNGTAAEAVAEGAELIQIDDNNAFTIRFQNSKGKDPQIVNGVAIASFHNAVTGIWFERTFEIDTIAKTLTISGDVDDSIAITKIKLSKFKVTPGKKKITVTWKKNTKADGYQIYYKQKGAKAKTVLINKNTTTKKVIKKLKKNKKVTVKVRGFKKYGETPVYTKWTTAKTVKVK